jgi:hypothetical protein
VDPNVLVAAGTAILTSVLSFVVAGNVEKRVTESHVEVQHRHAQQAELKRIISKNKMRLLTAAESLNHRMWNFGDNHHQGWMRVDGLYTPDNYYFLSFAFRLITFYALIRRIDQDLIYVDATTADKRDLLFIKYIRSLPQILTDISLLNGKGYDSNFANDHFFRNHLEIALDAVLGGENPVVDYGVFCDGLPDVTDRFRPIFVWLDGISPCELNRYRWDLLQLMHLLLIAFLNEFGYDFMRTDSSKIRDLLARTRENRLLDNFAAFVKRNQLARTKEIKKLRKSILQNARRTSNPVA